MVPKVLQSPSKTETKFEDLFTVLYAQRHCLQEEHASLIVRSTFHPTVSRFFAHSSVALGCMGCSDRDCTFDFRQQHLLGWMKACSHLTQLLADSENRIQAFETKCLRKLLCISHLEHKTNNRVLSKIKSLVGPQEPFLTTAKRWKLAWFGHVTLHNSLC